MIIRVGEVWYGRRGPGLNIIKVRVTDETAKTIEIEDLSTPARYSEYGHDLAFYTRERKVKGEFEFIEKLENAPQEV